jgi:hypothetical protein
VTVDIEGTLVGASVPAGQLGVRVGDSVTLVWPRDALHRLESE